MIAMEGYTTPTCNCTAGCSRCQDHYGSDTYYIKYSHPEVILDHPDVDTGDVIINLIKINALKKASNILKCREYVNIHKPPGGWGMGRF